MSALVTAIAHEVRQPLAAVTANAHAGLRWLRADNRRIDRVRWSLSCILRDAARTAEIISRIRALTEQRTASEHGTVDLRAVIRDAIGLVQHEIRKCGATLRFKIPQDLPPVTGDRLHLQQVVQNLTMNALEAMADRRRGRRRLFITVSCNAGSSVVVTVRDSGPGFSAEAARRAFEPFYTTKTHGMGVGLWLSRLLVEKQGGRLWLTRHPKSGAAVHFSLLCAGRADQ